MRFGLEWRFELAVAIPFVKDCSSMRYFDRWWAEFRC